MRTVVPLTITAFVGLLMIVEFFVKAPALSRAATELQNWGVIVAIFMMSVAAINLARIHIKRITDRRDNWLESAVLLLGLFSMVIVGLMYGSTSKPFSFLFNNFFRSLNSAVYSLLIFYIASASFRAFRARNLEATILLLGGVLVMLGRAPIGDVISPHLPKWANWLVKIPALAGNRGIMIGAAIGTVATGLRTITGIDRGHLGAE